MIDSITRLPRQGGHVRAGSGVFPYPRRRSQHCLAMMSLKACFAWLRLAQ
ncbi:MAG: hypothetical protein ABI222_16565 [Opitutaceae bacterium]